MYDDNLEERNSLAVERIRQIAMDCSDSSSETGECRIHADFAPYFEKTAGFILQMHDLADGIKDGRYENSSIEELSDLNSKLYADVADDNYYTSFANPAYSVEKMGEQYGRLLSFLYVEIRAMIIYAFEDRRFDMTIVSELFIEIYCLFEDEEFPAYKELQQAVYWFVSDYSDVTLEYRVRELLDTELSFATDIIMKSDLNDLRYLYRFGEYITDNEIRTASYLNSLPQERIEAMAATFTEGFRKGFELANKDLSKKEIVNIRYNLGFERLVREEIRQFEQLGLKTTIYRAAVNTINKKMHLKIGYTSTSPNKQMDYDHRFDNAIYLDSPFIERKLGAIKVAYEEHKEKASKFAGPAVMEIFGENPFEPDNKKEAFSLDKRQQKLSVRYDSESARIVNEYIRGDERSFTIIAYPIPEIGSRFEDIFDETVMINTLDYEKYKHIQQSVIDALDGAEYVEIKGKGLNRTDIRVSLRKLSDASKETVFENCLADVNIPLGEVFTSPVLKGTTGILNVSEVYLNELKYKNLMLRFEDGMVVDYNCDNFDSDEKNKAFIKENVLYNHESLPIGEFAIGTNTTAYVMANRYDIVYKLPILIVEKMGPHFAIGDTCYSWSEDIRVFNPNGKEIIAKDNEVSVLRKTDPEKAYFNCHTDVTIPYDEIGEITAVDADGTRNSIIIDGRFVIEGALELNKPFEKQF